MTHRLDELARVYEILADLCVAADIPPFTAVQYDADFQIASFVWHDSEFGLFILLEEHSLEDMTPAELREMWDEEEELAEELLAAAGNARLN